MKIKKKPAVSCQSRVTGAKKQPFSTHAHKAMRVRFSTAAATAADIEAMLKDSKTQLAVKELECSILRQQQQKTNVLNANLKATVMALIAKLMHVTCGRMSCEECLRWLRERLGPDSVHALQKLEISDSLEHVAALIAMSFAATRDRFTQPAQEKNKLAVGDIDLESDEDPFADERQQQQQQQAESAMEDDDDDDEDAAVAEYPPGALDCLFYREDICYHAIGGCSCTSTAHGHDLLLQQQ
jgi:hypothetical protein